MTRKLYHISTDIHHNGVFTPRIPKDRFDFENDTIPRICVSDSIEGCLSALPRIFEVEDGNRMYLQVVEIDVDVLKIPREAILTPMQLYRRGYLDDALITNEHWITVPFEVPASARRIVQCSFIETSSRFAIPVEEFEYFVYAYKNDIIESLDISTEDGEEITYQDFESFASMHGADYLLERGYTSVPFVHEYGFIDSHLNEEQTVYFLGKHLDELMDYVSNQFPTLTIQEHVGDECAYHVPAETDITKLFLFHEKLQEQLADEFMIW